MDYEQVFHETRFELNRAAWCQDILDSRGPGFYLLTVADDRVLRRFRQKKKVLASSWHRLDELWRIPPGLRRDVQDAAPDNVVLVARHVQRQIGNVSYFPRDWRKIHETPEDFAKELEDYRSKMGSFPEKDRLVSEQCVVCGQSTSQRCAACLVTRYCSRKCQKLNYQQHKTFCRLIKKTNLDIEEPFRWDQTEKRIKVQHAPADAVLIGLASLHLSE